MGKAKVNWRVVPESFGKAIILLQEKKLIVPDSNNPGSAFLGPKIWKNPITLPMLNGSSGDDDAEFSVMNIDDFLNENNFNIDRISPPLPDEEILGFGKEANKSHGSPMSEDSMDTSNPTTWSKPKNMLPKVSKDWLLSIQLVWDECVYDNQILGREHFLVRREQEGQDRTWEGREEEANGSSSGVLTGGVGIGYNSRCGLWSQKKTLFCGRVETSTNHKKEKEGLGGCIEIGSSYPGFATFFSSICRLMSTMTTRTTNTGSVARRTTLRPGGPGRPGV